LQKMLAKNPEERYATPGELRRVLKSIAAQDAHQETPEVTIGRGLGETELSASAPTRLSLPAALPEEAPARKRPGADKTPTPIPEAAPTSPAAGTQPATPEKGRAEAFHQRAVQVLAEGGGDKYVRELLDHCLQIDPYNITYRKTLREFNRRASGGMLGRWFGSVNVLKIKSQMGLARSMNDWAKVIDLGEQVLAHQRADADAHLAMADAADKLGLVPLARWFLEEGRAEAPANAGLMRAMACLHEKLKDWKPAIALWEKLSELDPSDREAHNKINDLSAQDLLQAARHRK
jgi:tetratricopeptide (TPR) repeat protein